LHTGGINGIVTVNLTEIKKLFTRQLIKFKTEGGQDEQTALFSVVQETQKR
jgi:hypothetical protein